MGFSAKLVIFTQAEERSDESLYNPLIEETSQEVENDKCTLWYDSGLVLDFGGVTRAEKLIKRTDIPFGSYERASICMINCFLVHLLNTPAKEAHKVFAPEIVDRLTEGLEKNLKTKTGEVYVLCHVEHQVEGRTLSGTDDYLSTHNRAVRDREGLQHHLERGFGLPFLEPPFLWASCSDLAQWWEEEELKRTALWLALLKDPFAVGIARGWYEQLAAAGEVGARAIFFLGI